MRERFLKSVATRRNSEADVQGKLTESNNSATCKRSASEPAMSTTEYSQDPEMAISTVAEQLPLIHSEWETKTGDTVSTDAKSTVRESALGNNSDFNQDDEGESLEYVPLQEQSLRSSEDREIGQSMPAFTDTRDIQGNSNPQKMAFIKQEDQEYAGVMPAVPSLISNKASSKPDVSDASSHGVSPSPQKNGQESPIHQAPIPSATPTPQALAVDKIKADIMQLEKEFSAADLKFNTEDKAVQRFSKAADAAVKSYKDMSAALREFYAKRRELEAQIKMQREGMQKLEHAKQAKLKRANEQRNIRDQAYGCRELLQGRICDLEVELEEAEQEKLLVEEFP